MEYDFSGNYPLILAGETAGEVKVSREGVYWSFEANCEKREELVRLSVYGEGKEGYLGIMEPAAEELRLSRRLSRANMKGFPGQITHGGQRGEPQNLAKPEETAPAENQEETKTEEQAETKTEEQAETKTEEPEEAKADEPDSYRGEFPSSYYNQEESNTEAPLDENKPPTLALSVPLDEIEGLLWGPCALPCSLFSGLAEKTLCGGISRAYLAREGDYLYLAAPEEAVRDFPKTTTMNFEDTITFSGEKYLICKIKRNGCDARF